MGYTNSFYANVTGNSNYVNQNGSANHSHGFVDIIGNNNQARQSLSGSNHGYSGGIHTYQVGDWNSASQTFSGSGLSHNQKGTITQTGDYNTANQNSNGAHNELYATQFGNSNYASQLADGNGNKSTIYVTGSTNNTTTTQTGDNHEASTTIDYYGDANTNADNNQVSVRQDGGNGSFSSNLVKGASNNVNISQTGSSHREYLQIFGSNNNVKIAADGTNNRGFWLLNGGADYNNLNVDMTGVNNKATGLIKGDNNIVKVTQNGDANLLGTDYNSKDGVAITGNSNNVNVKQLTNGNSSLNTIIGSGNTINVLQN